MDLTSIATSLISAKTQSLATSVAATLLKNDFDSEKNIAQLLTSSSSSANSLGSLAAGIGGNLDVTA
jgi:hypothetical protein